MARAGYGDLEVGAETSSVQAVHPVGSAAAPGIAFSTDTDVGLYRAGANQLGISAGGTGQVAIIDGVLQPVTTNDIDLGTASLQFKNAYIDGTIEADAYTVAGTALNEYIADTIGAMVGSNTETNIAVTYQDGDNTLDFVVASDLDTSGNAATATALASARTIGGVSFDGTGNIDLPGVNTAGNQATSGLAATATLAVASTAVTVTDNESTSENNLIAFIANAATATGNHGLEMDGNLTYNPSTGALTATSFSGTVSGTTKGPAFFMS
jgi:hypothetical protein